MLGLSNLRNTVGFEGIVGPVARTETSLQMAVSLDL
jgi:hypothetical protein